MDAYGGIRAGFSAMTKINRKDFGIDTDLPLDSGGVMIGDTAQMDIQAMLQKMQNAVNSTTGTGRCLSLCRWLGRSRRSCR